MRGRGEIVEPVLVGGLWLVLAPQAFAVSTADAYGWWDEDGGVTGPEPARLLECAARADVDALAEVMFNDLQPSVLRRRPGLDSVRGNLMEAGALAAMLSGSGPTMLGLVRNRQHAAAVARRVPSAIVVSGPG